VLLLVGRLGERARGRRTDDGDLPLVLAVARVAHDGLGRVLGGVEAEGRELMGLGDGEEDREKG